MALKEVDGKIYMYQGDTGHINIGGFNPQINYNVYLQISDEDGNFVGSQITATTGGSDTVRLYLNKTISDQLTVPEGDDFATYYIGVMKSEVGVDNEDTVIPDFGKKKPLIVFRKVVEGPTS